MGDPCLLTKSSHLPWHPEVEMGCFHLCLTVLKLQKAQNVSKPWMEMECEQISRNDRSLPVVQGTVIAASGQAAEVKASDAVMSAWVAAANGFVIDALEVEESDFAMENASGAPENEIPHD